MGCQACKCSQGEKKNEYDYGKEENSTQENNYQQVIDNQYNEELTKKFDEKIEFLGKYITPEEFEKSISQNILTYISNNQFKIPGFLKNDYVSYKINPIEFKNGNIFSGNWNEKLEMEGYGKYILKNENVFVEGIWEQGELKYARVFLPDGTIYIGEILNSTFNGQGKLISPNGEIYEGNFNKNEKSGEGKLNFGDGTIYEGNFDKNEMSGEGNMKWENGKIEYFGKFDKNFLSGKGAISNFDGEKYIGYFDKNLFNGKGVYIFDNGNSYDGNFELGFRKGKGIYKKKSGFCYEGEWENNLPNGIGLVKNDNCVIKCFWRDGKIIEKPSYEKGDIEECKCINLNFEVDEMKLKTNELSHLEQHEPIYSQYRAGTMQSFLED